MLTKRMVSALMALLVLTTASLASAAVKKERFSGSVNINTASEEQLCYLPGVGPSKAKAIISQRTVSPFKNVEELTNVKGIGQKLLAKLKPMLRVSGPAITGSSSPGVTERAR